MKYTVKIALSAVVIGIIVSAGMFSPTTESAQHQIGQSPAVHLSAATVTNGDVLLLEIDTEILKPSITDMHINFKGRTYDIFDHPTKEEGIYCALIGMPYRTKPGLSVVKLQWSEKGENYTEQIPLKVIAGTYKTDVLKVDSRRVNPNQKDRERAQRERQELNHIYASGSKARLWGGLFQLPVEKEITSPFGNKRVFNGQLKSYHNGVDFRAAEGTPAFAANSGLVRMAKNLFYSGNVAVIDHGTGIFTIYAHLDKLKVAAGQQIEKGQLIGLTGATGRVSGPHLHWGVKVTGTAVNPMQFIDVVSTLVQR